MSRNKLLTAIILCFVLIIGLILVTVYLTGGRDIGEFTTNDEYIFGGFVVAECAVIVAFVLFLRKLTKRYPSTHVNVQAPDFPATPSAKKHAKLTYICSIAATIIFWCVGLYVNSATKEAYETMFVCGAVCCILIPVLFVVVNIILKKLYLKKFNSMNFAERQSYIVSHRDKAYQTVLEKQAVLKRIYLFSRISALTFILCGVILAFCYRDLSTYILLLSFLLIRAGLAHFYRASDTEQLEEAECVTEEEYPALYGLARKAADAMGYNKKVRIFIDAGFNAGIAAGDDHCLIQLGVLMINNLGKDELYTVLLHEFAHLNAPSYYSKKGIRHPWLSPPCSIFTPNSIIKYLYFYLGTVWQFNYSMYVYASSVIMETEADKAMLFCGDAKIAASALVKLHYYQMYDWEKGTYDTVSPFVSEEYDRKMVERELNGFKTAVKERFEFWNTLAEKEIISRSTTHPILRMRLETLGVSEIKALESVFDDAYRLELSKAVEYAEGLFAKNFDGEEYAKIRKSAYLEPKKRIEAWEEEGRPIVAEGYADIISDLRTLGRNIEANEIARQSMEVLDDVALHNAYFMYGAFLLHSFNDEGLEYIYEAIESNSNYIQEGMSLIGAYCCMTGNAEALEEYRQRVDVYGQDIEDKYEKMGYIDKDDTLVTEELPDGMLEKILTFINTVDEGMIERIHLVRKVITDDFFTSAFVITFLPVAEEEQMHGIMHKIFSYLDTCSDWQFSLFMNCDVPMASIIAVENSLVYQREQ